MLFSNIWILQKSSKWALRYMFFSSIVLLCSLQSQFVFSYLFLRVLEILEAEAVPAARKDFINCNLKNLASKLSCGVSILQNSHYAGL